MGQPGVIHDFQESLARSHAASELPLWEVMYRRAFHDFAAMVDHRQDGEHQREGIDRSVILKNSKQILIDEKIRGRNKKTGRVYEDIALEYWSVEGQKPGWVCKPLKADYIAYAIAPLGRGYLLPVREMQAAWREHGRRWIEKYPLIRSQNNGYVTVSVGVPVDILLASISYCLRSYFPKCEYEND